MKKIEKTAVFIDLANSEDLDLRCVIDAARKIGTIEEIRCYGDFSQRHIADLSLELYSMNFTMVHCPSFNNGNGGFKRTDDRLLEKGIRDTLINRPSIINYVLVTSDADIIPSCHSIKERNKQLVLYSSMDACLGRVMRACGFDIREIPKRTGVEGPTNTSRGSASNDTSGSDNGKSDEINLGREQVIAKIDQLEKTSRYLCYMQTVGRLANGNAVMKSKVQRILSELIDGGIVENYEYRLPAIRLNRQHPSVTSALHADSSIRTAAESKPAIVKNNIDTAPASRVGELVSV